MRKELIIGAGVGIPLVILMIFIGGDGHSSFDLGESEITPGDPKQIELESPNSEQSSLDCSGTAQCFEGTVTKIIDGDTIIVDGQSVRFSLSSAPELKMFEGQDSKKFIETICPVGSKVLVDEDDGQILGSYGRMVGVITCNGVNLNSELLDANLGYLQDRFCDSSEFGKESWAQKHGCSNSVSELENSNNNPEPVKSNCDTSYPDFCIPSSPPDLDCKDIAQKGFTVLQPDPHRFDSDKDGIGCES
ncbi:MAG: thermonuclease family protein [Nitrosopumilus sp.]|nr:thermonuclease family protein [Nitrosopumilus sp.]